jgi:pentatricopeptide repeat protein
LLEIAGGQGDMESVNKMFNNSKNIMSEFQFNTLIGIFHKNGDPRGVLKVYKEMKTRNFQPSNFSLYPSSKLLTNDSQDMFF